MGTGGASGSGGGGSGGSGGLPGSGGSPIGSGGLLGSGGLPGSGGTSTGGAGSGGSGTGGAGSSTGGAGVGGSGTGGAGSGGGSNAGPTLHVFLTMGQSNMAGVAPKNAGDANTDERLQVWGGCNQPAGQWNLANPPLSDCPGGSGINLSTSVDPGIWFAKTLLPALPAGDTIGLIGTAESGESINTFLTGGEHYQRIHNKIAAVKDQENVRLSGIIFHQGESDNTQASWPGKVLQLYNEVKDSWGATYDFPFILGELPAGGCCSAHNVRVHEAADLLPMGAWVTQDGTAVMDQYHFDHASVILMGERYGEKMIEALGW